MPGCTDISTGRASYDQEPEQPCRAFPGRLEVLLQTWRSPSERATLPPEAPLKSKEDAAPFPSLAKETLHKVSTTRQRKRLWIQKLFF